MSNIKRAALAGGFWVSLPAAADVNGDMNNFFNKLGFASNTSQPQVWQGQAAGYASGGSLYARTQVKTIQLVSMTLPDINAGCGGIDAYLGSFSLSTANSCSASANKSCPTPRATSLIWHCRPLYRKSKPQRLPAEDGQRHQQHEPQQLPGRTGHCRGLFPRTQVAQQKVCQDIAGESNIFADWAASRQGCSVGGQMDKVQDKASDKDKERVMKNINIMWNALSKNRLFDDNKELKEFVMTLTGT
jgi:conjugative transfer pilus assembly protein TraH